VIIILTDKLAFLETLLACPVVLRSCRHPYSGKRRTGFTAEPSFAAAIASLIWQNS